MKKKILATLCAALLVSSLSACGGGSQEEYSKVVTEKEDVQAELEETKGSLEQLQTEYDTLQTDYDALKTDYDTLKTDYDTYKEKMKPFEEMDAAEAEARKIAAEEAAAKKKAKEEKEAKKQAEKQAEKEKKGYDTGIKYDQLARNPDDYKGEKVKFKGKVVQIMEGDSEIQMRLAVDSDYDMILYCGYDPSIVSSRILEDDIITIYGTSIGTISYNSTMGGKITIPGVYVDKIDQ